MKRFLFFSVLLILAWGLSFGQNWSTPINVSQSTQNVRWAQVAMGPSGEVYVVWEENYQNAAGSDIFLRSYDGRKWSDIVKLKNSPNIDAQRPSICCSVKGVVAVIWGEGQPSQAKVREYDPRQKKWLPTVQVSVDGINGITEQYVAVDPAGNMYTAWAGKMDGKQYTRCRINGVWEGIKRLDGGVFSEHPVMAAGADGWVWVAFRKRFPPERKVVYSKRKANTDWTTPTFVWEGGSSQAHPGITVGPNNIPYVAYCADSGGNNSMVFLVTLREGNKSRELIFDSALQHDGRVAIDAFGNKHVAEQYGGGDFGIAVRYRRTVNGQWGDVITMPDSCCGVKLPGISADPFGNVSMVWTSNGQAMFTSLYPVTIKKLDPPVNLSASLTFKPDPTYTLNWEANPDNTVDFVQGYNIYKKETTDTDFVKILTLSKSTLTATLTYPEVKPGIQFGITTQSTSATESEMVFFQYAIPTIYSPVNTAAKVTVDSVKGLTTVTYALTWQANPQNPAKYVKAYKIYKKEGTGEFTLFQTLSSDTFSLTRSYTDLQTRITFAITTLSTLDTESSQLVFGVQSTGLAKGTKNKSGFTKIRD